MAKTASDTTVLHIYYTSIVNVDHQPDLLHACSKSNQWALQQACASCATLSHCTVKISVFIDVVNSLLANSTMTNHIHPQHHTAYTLAYTSGTIIKFTVKGASLMNIKSDCLPDTHTTLLSTKAPTPSQCTLHSSCLPKSSELLPMWVLFCRFRDKYVP